MAAPAQSGLVRATEKNTMRRLGILSEKEPLSVLVAYICARPQRGVVAVWSEPNAVGYFSSIT